MRNKKVVLIFGNQRSGTTATLKLFNLMLENVKVYEETGDSIHRSDLLDGNLKIRLTSSEQLKQIISDLQEDIVLIKPLVESYKAKMLIDELGEDFEVKGLWLFRDYFDVIKSMHNEWGSEVGDENLRLALNSIGRGDVEWRAGGIGNDEVNLINEIKREFPLNKNDSTALVWFLRNLNFFKQFSSHTNQIMLVQYERLVCEKNYFRFIVEKFLGIPVNGKNLFGTHFHSNSIKKGQSIVLTKQINFLCEIMSFALKLNERKIYAKNIMIDPIKKGSDLI